MVRSLGYKLVKVEPLEYVYIMSHQLPSGNLLHNYGKSPFSMGKSTISMVIFNSYVKLPEGISCCITHKPQICEDIWVSCRLASLMEAFWSEADPSVPWDESFVMGDMVTTHICFFQGKPLVSKNISLKITSKGCFERMHLNHPGLQYEAIFGVIHILLFVFWFYILQSNIQSKNIKKQHEHPWVSLVLESGSKLPRWTESVTFSSGSWWWMIVTLNHPKINHDWVV